MRTLHVYRLHPEYTRSGGHYAHWVNDGTVLMDTPHDRVGSVLADWPPDLEFPVVRNGNDCDVLFNPCGLIFSQSAKDTLSPICGVHAEWLPLHVISYGTMYLFHPIASVPLGRNARYRPKSGDNIVEIYEYDFDEPENLPPCFLIPQPESSPAGQGGFSCIGEYVTDALRTAMSQYRGVDFACVYTSP